jgi:hypothetical protein
MAPPIYWDMDQSVGTHVSMLRQARALLQTQVHQEGVSVNFPFYDLRELQMNFQYTGN